jgi:hypothetical protein
MVVACIDASHLSLKFGCSRLMFAVGTQASRPIQPNNHNRQGPQQPQDHQFRERSISLKKGESSHKKPHRSSVPKKVSHRATIARRV